MASSIKNLTSQYRLTTDLIWGCTFEFVAHFSSILWRLSAEICAWVIEWSTIFFNSLWPSEWTPSAIGILPFLIFFSMLITRHALNSKPLTHEFYFLENGMNLKWPHHIHFWYRVPLNIFYIIYIRVGTSSTFKNQIIIWSRWCWGWCSFLGSTRVIFLVLLQFLHGFVFTVVLWSGSLG